MWRGRSMEMKYMEERQTSRWEDTREGDEDRGMKIKEGGRNRKVRRKIIRKPRKLRGRVWTERNAS